MSDDDICAICGRTQWEHDSCDVMACGRFVPLPDDETGEVTGDD